MQPLDMKRAYSETVVFARRRGRFPAEEERQLLGGGDSGGKDDYRKSVSR